MPRRTGTPSLPIAAEVFAPLPPSEGEALLFGHKVDARDIAARRLAEQRYSIPAMAEAYAAVYDLTLQRQR